MNLKSLVSILVGLAVGAGVAVSEAGAQRPAGQGTPSATAQQPSESSADRASAGARQFINDMAVAGMAEVELGKMASERGSSPEIKEFGELMVKDHSKANDELKQIASELAVTPPAELDKKHRDLADKLSKLQGAEFDREYASAMVNGHQEVASKLRSRADHKMTSSEPGSGREAPTGTGARPPQSSGSGASVGTSGDRAGDAKLNQWAAKTLPTVQEHLERARELQKKSK
jgi:putative membrane protein